MHQFICSLHCIAYFPVYLLVLSGYRYSLMYRFVHPFITSADGSPASPKLPPGQPPHVEKEAIPQPAGARKPSRRPPRQGKCVAVGCHPTELALQGQHNTTAAGGVFCSGQPGRRTLRLGAKLLGPREWDYELFIPLCGPLAIFLIFRMTHENKRL